MKAEEEAEERAIAERSRAEAAGHIAAQQRRRLTATRRRYAIFALVALALGAITVAALWETVERAMAPEPPE